MFGVERVRKLLDVIIHTECVKGVQPVSAVLIAGSDAGKTQLLLEHIPTTCRILNDFHYSSILPMLEGKNGDSPKRIIVPDFNLVLSHRPVVASLTCALLLGLMGEGLDEIPGVDGASKLRIEKLRDKGVRLSMLTAMTGQMFRAKRGKWRDTGFLRRMLPIHYKYSSSTVAKIQDYLALTYADARNLLVKYAREPFRLPKSQQIHVNNAYHGVIKERAESTRKDHLLWFWENRRDGMKHPICAIDYPFTIQQTFTAICAAHALMDGRDHVGDADILFLDDARRFVRYDVPEEL